MAVKNEVIELAEKIKTGLELKKGIISEPDSEAKAFSSHMPESLSMDLIDEVKEYEATFIAAAGKAVAEMGIDALAKDKAINAVTSKIKMGGNDSINFTLDRSKTYKNHLTDGKETTKYGVLSSNLEVRAGKNAGQLKAVRVSIAELALDKLA